MPVAVGDFLKKFGDLLSKKYKKIKSNELVVKASDSNMDIEAVIMNKYPDLKNSSSPEGSVKVTYSLKEYNSKMELFTDSQNKFTAKIENKPFKGLKLVAKGNGIPPQLVSKKAQTNGSLEANYEQGMFKGKAGVTYVKQPAYKDPVVKGCEAAKVAVEASVGQNGISVGGAASGKLQDGKYSLSKWSVGSNITAGSIIFGLLTNKFEDVTAGAHYKMSNDTSVGTQVAISSVKADKKKEMKAANKTDIGLGVEHRFNKATLLQTKIEANFVSEEGGSLKTDFSYGGVVEYKYPQLASKLQLTGVYKGGSTNFGICCTYGDQ
ncbi:hypothetical protein AAMO2058_000182900 [Amorphochlora amoebiformis]